MGKKITIQGKVHNVGYRLFLLEQADAIFIPFFDARNIKINNKEALIVLVDGEESQLGEFVDFVNSNYPEKADVKKVTVEDYSGKIREIDKFRQSLNTLQLSKIVQSGLEISVDTKSIKEGVSSIKEDTHHLPEIRDELRFKSRPEDISHSVPITLYPSSMPSSIEPSCLMIL